MEIRVTRPDHPEVLEVIASHHCVQRFRKRMRIRSPGLDAVAEQLADALDEADFTRWAPPWVLSARDTELWALLDDIAFPLASTPVPGRWLATTCLVRGTRS
ncbi:MAG: hypothetical protein ACYCUM_13850 [Solirubrobacteraceae bacterium]